MRLVTRPTWAGPIECRLLSTTSRTKTTTTATRISTAASSTTSDDGADVTMELLACAGHGVIREQVDVADGGVAGVQPAAA